MRSMTSKLLSKAKKAALGSPSDLDGVTASHVTAAIAFAKACGGLKNAKKALQVVEDIASGRYS